MPAGKPVLSVRQATLPPCNLDPDGSASGEELLDEPSGTIVHLRLLPGSFEEYSDLVRRACAPV